MGKLVLGPLIAICLSASSYGRTSNEIFFSWVDGPSARFPSGAQRNGPNVVTGSDRVALRSARYGLLFDARQLDIARLTLDAPSKDPATPEAPEFIASSWHGASLRLAATINGQICRAKLSDELSSQGTPQSRRLTYPVRVIESGNYFHHIAVYGIRWHSDSEVVSGRGRLELRAWADVCLVEVHLDSPGEMTDVSLVWESKEFGFVDQQQLSRIAQGSSAKLRVGMRVDGGKLVPWRGEPPRTIVRCADGDSVAEWDSASGSWVFKMGRLVPVESRADHPYPIEQDRVTELPFKITNPSNEPIDARLRFIHPRHSVTGFVPMLYDADGRQTGISVQTSKNWHKSKEYPLPYQGTWIHGSTRVRVPADSTRELRYAIVHSRWQGVPAASVGQLSLVGWGHNGLWTQFAIGSWGEQLCIQPGRLQRRCFVTDIRPLLSYGKKREAWQWTGNVGGCETMLTIDRQGRFLPWGGVSIDYVRSGPNLTHTRVRERAADGSMSLHTDTFLPRSDDITRAYLSVQLSVNKPIEFKRLALFQLGTDFYNSNDPTTIAYGTGHRRLDSRRPPSAQSEYVVEAQNPGTASVWVTLLGSESSAEDGLGEGTRALIVRHFEAVLGGRQISNPWIAAYRDRRGNLLAELVPPPGTTQLNSGDSMKLLVEIAVFPTKPEDYYGTDKVLTTQLAAHAETWRMAAWEASRNLVKLSGERIQSTSQTGWPHSISVKGRNQIDFEFSGGAGLVPVQLVDLASPTDWRIVELHGDQSSPLGVRYPEEAKPQIDANGDAGTWTATLSLRPPDLSDQGATRALRWEILGR